MVGPLCVAHCLQLFLDNSRVTIFCTQSGAAVELHQRWPPFLVERLVKQTQFTRVRFRPPLLIIKSLDASGGSVFRNLLGAAKGALIRAAASTQPLGCDTKSREWLL